MKDFKIAYFGGEPIGVPVLERLCDAGFTPQLVVTNPDRPQGRKMTLTPPPLKEWAAAHDIEIFQPENLKQKEDLKPLTETDWDLFIVVAYSNLIPKWLLDLPKHKTLNLHPSLLPKYRGPSPIRSVILADDKQTGMTIIELDEKMDHGPILDQAILDIKDEEWPLPGNELDSRLAALGGQLLCDTLPRWLAGEITPTPQDHAAATFTKKISKADSELKIDPHNLPAGEEARAAFLQICAYAGWPETFFIHEGKRIKITKAELTPEGELRLLRIIPSGKKEMDFADYQF